MTNDNLCFDEFTIINAVEVVSNPDAFFTFGPSTIFSSEPEVTFTNGSSFADSYNWSFGDGSATSTDEHPIHSYPDLVAGIYSVELEAQKSLGCSDTYTLDVVVVDEIIFYIPNAFTPDDDNYNPVFKPVMTSGLEINSYQMEVFNRWGELIFKSNEVDTGWDGTYKGKLAQDGTYVWKVYFKEQFNDKKHEHIGHVTLIR
jgi:gliding motility-associated-like protein